MSIWFGSPAVEEITQFTTDTVTDLFDIAFTTIGDDWLEATMPVTKKLQQAAGIMHGGVSVLLAETVCSIGATLTLDRRQQFAVGQEINANHLRPGIPGDVITARATLVSRGRSSQVWDIRLRNQDEKLVCISRCTMAIRDHA